MKSKLAITNDRFYAYDFSDEKDSKQYFFPAGTLVEITEKGLIIASDKKFLIDAKTFGSIDGVNSCFSEKFITYIKDTRYVRLLFL